MFGNKILLAAAAYIVGSVVASTYNSKKWEKVREDIQSAKQLWEDSNKIILNSFIDTHVNALTSLKAKYVTPENKAFFEWKVTEAKKAVAEYAKEWESLLEELKVKGWDYAEEAKVELQKLYESKKEEIEEVIWSPDKVEKIKNKLSATYKDLKSKIEK